MSEFIRTAMMLLREPFRALRPHAPPEPVEEFLPHSPQSQAVDALASLISSARTKVLSALREEMWESLYHGSETHQYLLNRLRVLHRCSRIYTAICVQSDVGVHLILDALYAAKHQYSELYKDDDGSAWREFQLIEDALALTFSVRRLLNLASYRANLVNRAQRAGIISDDKIVDEAASSAMWRLMLHIENSDATSIAVRSVRGMSTSDQCPCSNFIRRYYNQHNDTVVGLRLYAVMLSLRDGTALLDSGLLSSRIADMDKDVQLIEFFSIWLDSGDSGTVAVAVNAASPSQVRFHLLPVSNKDIAVEFAALQLACSKESGSHFDKSNSNTLGAKLLGNLIDPQIKKCRFVPTPNMRNFSLELLSLSGRCLGIEHIISYHSTSTLINQPSPLQVDLSNVYIVGDCDYDANLYSGTAHAAVGLQTFFNPLVGAAREVSFLNSLGAKTFTGSNATKEQVMGIKNASLLHIASHAFFCRQNHTVEIDSGDILKFAPQPGFSYSAIALSGVNGWINEDNIVLLYPDGMLTISELASLGLQRGATVVLSCCETGVSEVDSVGSHIGLREALENAGAGWIVSTMWQVDDISIAQFCEMFYVHLSKEKEVDVALLKARQEAQDTLPYSTWAAFTAYRTNN